MSNINQPTAVYTGYKHSCVVDAAGYYKDLVQVHIYTAADGTVEDRPQYYNLQAGERLVDAALPSTRPHAGADGLIRPRWDDEAAWVEGATTDEIAAWEAEHPAPEPVAPPADDLAGRVATLETDKADKAEVQAVWDSMATAYSEGVQQA